MFSREITIVRMDKSNRHLFLTRAVLNQTLTALRIYRTLIEGDFLWFVCTLILVF